MSREMLSRKAFENWYFEYCEAERDLLDAKRNFEVKKRDACLFIFSAYVKWCKNRFGDVLRPEQSVIQLRAENPVVLFFAEFKIDSCLRNLLAQLLNQAYDERFGSASESE